MSNFDSWNRRRGALDSFGKMSMFDEMDKLEARARARDPNSPIPPDAPGDKSALYGFTGVGNQQFNQLADMMRVHWSKGRGPMGESEPEDFQQEWGDLPYSPIPPDAPGAVQFLWAVQFLLTHRGAVQFLWAVQFLLTIIGRINR